MIRLTANIPKRYYQTTTTRTKANPVVQSDSYGKAIWQLAALEREMRIHPRKKKGHR